MLHSDVHDPNWRPAQLKTLVVAPTKKEAISLLAITRHEFEQSFSQTGNDEQLEYIKSGQGVWRQLKKGQWKKVVGDHYERIVWRE